MTQPGLAAWRENLQAKPNRKLINPGSSFLLYKESYNQ